MAHILVVDDTVLTHRLLELMLRQNDHTIHSSHNGLEAKEYLKSPDTDVNMIITDINMPYLDGMGLMEWLRSEERYKAIPVIVLTASGQEHIAAAARQKGATGFLNQPFSSWELKNLVEECLKES